MLMPSHVNGDPVFCGLWEYPEILRTLLTNLNGLQDLSWLDTKWMHDFLFYLRKDYDYI